MTAIIIVAGTKSDFCFIILQKVYFYDVPEMSRFIGILGKPHNHWQYCLHIKLTIYLTFYSWAYLLS